MPVILAIIISFVGFTVGISILGISPQGASLLGDTGSATSYANTTFWEVTASVYSAFNISIFIPLGIIVVLLLCGFGYALAKSSSSSC